MNSFVYNNEEDMIKAQKALIELGLHILQFSEYVDFELRELYYSILCHILKRSELSLSQLGYHSIDRLTKVQLKMKEENAIQY